MKRWVAASLTSWLWRWTETWSSLTVSSRLSSSQLLSQFISPHTGRIYGRHITGERITEALNGCVCSVVWIKRFMSIFYSAGLCGRKQKEVSKAIKKAHSMGTFPSDEPFKVTFLHSEQMNQISCTKYHVNVSQDSEQRNVWCVFKCLFQSDISVCLLRFHVGDSQTSRVHEGSQHLWDQTSGLVIVVFV